MYWAFFVSWLMHKWVSILVFSVSITFLIWGDLLLVNLDSDILGDFDPDLQKSKAGVDIFFLFDRLIFYWLLILRMPYIWFIYYIDN
jgi:hypothetical protein